MLKRIPANPSEKFSKAFTVVKKTAAIAAVVFLLSGWIANVREDLRRHRTNNSNNSEVSNAINPPDSVMEGLPGSLRNRLEANKDLCPICSRTR